MAATITGIADNGERLAFERWLFEAYTQGRVTDPMLLAQLNRCREFHSLGLDGRRVYENAWRKSVSA